jgi:acyl transferase domain-containing protein
MEPIAIVGLAFKLPQEAVDEASLWEVLQQRRNLMTTWPKDRAAVESFHDGGSKKLSTMHARGAHFLKEDPAVFDAPFFSITSKEAAAMDPQQRWVLETAYHAFENAGIPAQQLRGSLTAVFGASMADDYLRLIARDPDNVPRMVTTGAEPSILPNRVSWYFNLQGPSIHINTACSSSLVALDQACQSLRDGNASAVSFSPLDLISIPHADNCS